MGGQISDPAVFLAAPQTWPCLHLRFLAVGPG